MNNLDCDGKSVLQVEQPNSGNAVERLTKEHILDKSPFFMGEWAYKKGQKGHGSQSKIVPKEHFVAPFGAKRGADCFVLVI